MSDLLEASLGPIGGLVGNIFNASSQRKENRRNREWQSAENQKNRDYATTMWNNQNAYNDPTQQMARLKGAGINPHLAYSSGGVQNIAAQSSSPSTGSTMGVAPKVDPQNIANLSLIGAQIDNIRADTDKKRADAKLSLTTNQGQEYINGKTAIEFQNWENKVISEISQVQQQTKLFGSQIELNETKIRQSIQDINESVAKESEIRQHVDNLKSEKKLTDVQVDSLFAGISLTYAKIKETFSNINYTNSKTQTESLVRSNIEADIRNKNELNRKLNRDNYWGDKYDGSNFESNTFYNSYRANKMLQESYNELKRGGLIDAQVSYTDWQTMNLKVLTARNSVGLVEDVKQLINPVSLIKNVRTSIQSFDSKGKFKGETITHSQSSPK